MVVCVVTKGWQATFQNSRIGHPKHPISTAHVGENVQVHKQKINTHKTLLKSECAEHTRAQKDEKAIRPINTARSLFACVSA